MPIAPAQTRTSPSSIWLGMLVLYVVWGSTYLGIAIAVETIPPFIMGGTRFLIAGVILLAWSFVRGGGSIPMPSRRQFRDSLIVGSLLLGAGMGLVAFGETLVPSGITALLIAMMPVWVAILGRVFFAERLPALAIVGIVVGFAGVAILAGPSVFGSSDALDPIGLAAIIISPIAWAVGSLYASHRAVLPSQPLVATGIQMFCGGTILFVVGALTGEFGRFDVSAVSSASLLAMVYLTVIGSLLAFTAYGWLLRVAPLPLVATYAYVNPVVAVLLGAFVLHEAIEPRTLVAGTVIVAAVALIVTARGRMQAPHSAPAEVLESASATTSATSRATTR